MIEIDSKYQRRTIVKSEIPYINFSLVKNLPVIGICFCVILIVSLITPFLPPLHRSYDYRWKLPTSPKEYFSEIKYGLLYGASIFILVLIYNFFLNIHKYFDRKFGYKKVGVFKVKAIWNLLTRKIVFFNNAHFLTLVQRDLNFENLEVGQIIEIERTATNKLVCYKILTS